MNEINELEAEDNKFNALPPIAGYIYQFKFFLFKLLTIQPDEEVSFEKYDDAATEKAYAITFYQLKFNLGAALDQKSISLTNRSPELWKTLDVWRKIVINEDKKGSKRLDVDQKKFIEDNNFVLVCNKTAENNKLIKLCKDLNNPQVNANINDEDVDKILNEISQESRKTKNKKAKKNSVQSFIDGFISFKYRKLLLSNVTIEQRNYDEFDEECRKYIYDALIFPKDQLQEVYDNFTIEVLKELNRSVKHKMPLSYNFRQQRDKFRQVFSYSRETPIDFQIKVEKYNQDFYKLTCIKQLLKIKHLKRKDIDKLITIVSHFYSFKNKYEELIDNSLLVDSEIVKFEDSAITFWRNEFNFRYDDTDHNTSAHDLQKIAKEIVHVVLQKELYLRTNLSLGISNGAYYYFSDECKIGWDRNWKKLFKK